MTEWTLADAYELLAVAQSFDRRTVGDFDAEGWRRAMHGLQLDDAKAAIVEHYTNSDTWLMPAHVRDGVKRIRAARLEKRPFDWVPDADPDDPIAYQRALRAGNERAADGTEQPRDLTALPSTFRDVPKASPAAIEIAKDQVRRIRPAPRQRDLSHAEAIADMDRIRAEQDQAARPVGAGVAHEAPVDAGTREGELA
jgi:hypothetical protein